MPFDPTYPPTNAPLQSAPMRGQLNSLKALIDLLQSITAAQIDGVNTLPPGDPANVTVSVTGSTLHFSFDIPQGDAGAAGGEGQQGIQGEEGPQGMPGEVSLQQLTDAIATTSSNSNGVSTLEMTVNDPPTQGEVLLIANKLDELINAMRR
jgi:hypothetical protein